MKPMHKLLLLAIMVVLVCNCEKDDPNIEFADDQFLNALLIRGIDTNHDGKISYSEAEDVRSLIITNSSIKDFSGISAFKNLDTLICYENLLTSLDVSQMRNLVYLYCQSNTLTSLNISRNTQLKSLGCSDNYISLLDVTNLSSLEYLWCSSNYITNLDLSNNTMLEVLSCDANRLTTLNVSSNPNLAMLECSGNSIVSLDLTSNTQLYHLVIENMPLLNSVCVFETPTTVYSNLSPNVNVSSDCSD